MHQSWFVSRHGTSDELCYTRAGSRPGSSWADLIYAFVLKRILAQIHEAAVGEDLLTPLQLDRASGPFAGDETLWATETAWADDVALPVSDGCPQRLMAKTSRLSSIVLACCHKHGMVPNLKPKKTALIVALRGRGSQRAKAQYFPKGQRGVWLADLKVEVQVASHYMHLGGLVEPAMQMVSEARIAWLLPRRRLTRGAVFSLPTGPFRLTLGRHSSAPTSWRPSSILACGYLKGEDGTSQLVVSHGS